MGFTPVASEHSPVGRGVVVYVPNCQGDTSSMKTGRATLSAATPAAMPATAFVPTRTTMTESGWNLFMIGVRVGVMVALEVVVAVSVADAVMGGVSDAVEEYVDDGVAPVEMEALDEPVGVDEGVAVGEEVGSAVGVADGVAGTMLYVNCGWGGELIYGWGRGRGGRDGGESF